MILMLRMYRPVDRRIAADTRVQMWPWHRRRIRASARPGVPSANSPPSSNSVRHAAVYAPSFRPLSNREGEAILGA
jgi:hypothetical protein